MIVDANLNTLTALIRDEGPPVDLHALRQRMHFIAGRTVAELANCTNQAVPKDLRQHKGWLGQLLEVVLGASAQSRPLPDFPHLGVELKSLPLTMLGQPTESTYVCTVPLLRASDLDWATSWVRRKLLRVCWVPVLAESGMPLDERRVGTPFLWQPNVEQAQQLANDWQELTTMVALGQLDEISAHHGKILQIRPKAANAKSLAMGLNQAGERIATLPRGFYLRPHFTASLVRDYFGS